METNWETSLEKFLIKDFGKQKATSLAAKYSLLFPSSYKGDFSPQEAAQDINLIEQLSKEDPLQVVMYEHSLNNRKQLYVKLLQFEKPIPLSDILPELENMGLRTYDERPYRITLDKEKLILISDFSVEPRSKNPINIDKIKKNFYEGLIHIVKGQCENDGFNKLILNAGLNWREIIILRVYAKYLQQIGFRFTQTYIEKTLNLHAELAADLVTFFKTKLDPKHAGHKLKEIEDTILKKLTEVASLDEDRILRQFFKVMQATIRTNYFKKSKDGNYKDYLSIKLVSALVPDLPLPFPLYEVFVYSTHFEAIHLRSEKVARGGIRWSDRPEDFRTEILGLMKAQKVKNAIIVPSGAKGGFVLKKIPTDATREILLKEVVACYTQFIKGLLDITDNIVQNKIVRPKEVVCYDDEDPYLVVAADKGTATFSDIANGIAAEYQFWLGDGFASGGSHGYDHKKMGITARGAWESIKRHFRVANIDIKETYFTVVGIGDMSGDVFGNGMIYTDRIKLIAAFDHRDIFIDPNPDPIKTFAERLRLFNLPTSSWQDFNAKLLSKGGGIFKRSLKSIPLNSQIKKVLGIENNIEALAPNDLIKAILKAPVDLLYNGGIGTYVKSSAESHADVGDKTNDYCRINGDELRCKIVGEGGNLGFTQLARVEYALKGGMINTDFIDNSAGVDCSDHEVNMKILLNKEVLEGHLTEKKRNQILASLTTEVANQVLSDNYQQALAMSISTDHGSRYISLYQSFIHYLEELSFINRAVEFLPDDKTIMDRKAEGKGLTSPELAVLLAYSKIHLKKELLKSNVLEETYFSKFIENAIPHTLVKKFETELQQHRLKREIIATQLTNQIVNEMGTTFIFRIHAETGAEIGDIAKAYAVSAAVFDSKELHCLIDSLDFKIDSKIQFELLHYVRNLMNLSTRWFLRSKYLPGDPEFIIKKYKPRVAKLAELIPDLMSGTTKTYLENLQKSFQKEGISSDLARRIAIVRAIYTSLNIIEVATEFNFDLVKTAQFYFEIGGRFHLVWFRDQIATQVEEGHWNTLARLTLRDELDILQKQLTVAIMNSKKTGAEKTSLLIERWISQNEKAIARWEEILERLYQTPVVDHKMFFIALRELSNWIGIGAVATM